MIKDGRKKASQSTIIEKLKDDKTMAQKYLDIVGVMVVAIDSEENIVLINKKGCDILGCKKEEAIGKNWFDTFLSEKLRNEVRSIFRKLMLGEIEPAEYFENPVLTKTGEERMILWHNTILKDDAGDVIGTLSSGEDVTDRKHVEEAIKESEHRYRSFVENFQGIAYRAGEHWTPEFLHGAVEEITGYTEEEFKAGKPTWDQVIYPEDLAKIFTEDEHKLHTTPNHSYEREYRIVRKDGHIRWVREYIKSVSLNPYTLEGTLYDITDQKKAEEAIVESEIRYHNLFEKSPNSITLVNSSGMILDCNEATEKLIGCSKEEIIGKTFDTLFTLKSDDLTLLKKIHEDHMKGHEVKPFELEVIRKDGERRWISIITSLQMIDGVLKDIQVISNDITESKKAEEELRKLSSVVGQSVNSIAILDKEGNVEYVNSKFLEAYELSPEDVVGKNWREFLPKSVAIKEKYPEIKRRVLEEGSVWKGEITDKSAKGEDFWRKATFFPIKDIKDKITHIVYISEDITKQKKAEEALRESHERNRRLMEMSFNGIAIHSEGKIVYVNHVGMELLGASNPDQVVGKDVIEFIHPDYRKITAERMQRIHDAQGAAPIEEKFVRIDGTSIYVEVMGIPITYHDKPAVQVVFRDISARKIAEEALRESEEKFRMFFENEPEYCYMISPEGTILDVNRSTLKALGYKKKELVGQPLKMLYHPDSISKMEILFKKWKKKGKLKNEEIEIVTKNGKPLTVLLSSDSMKGKNGEILHSISVQRDITERKKIEEVLKKSEEKYRSLVEKAGAGIAVSDVKGRLQYVNEALCEMIGHTAEELIGEHFIDFIHPDDAESILALFENTFDESDKVVSLEFRLIHKKGHPVYMFTQPTEIRHNGHIVGFNAILTDITERKLVEKTIEKRNEELSTLNTIAGTINQSLELNMVLNIALEETMHVLNGEGGLVSLYDEASQTYIPAIHDGLSEGVMKEVTGFKVGEGITGQTAQLGVPILVPDLTDETSDLSPISVEKGWSSLVSVPLKSKDTIIGVMTLSSREKEHFTPEDMEILGAIGNQVGMAVENARLYEASQRELTERRKVEKALRDSQAELSKIFNNIPILVMLVDNERRVRRINRVGSDFTGRSEKEMIGLRGGEALRCINSLDDPKGCGFAPVCKECVVRKTVLDTFETNKRQHQIDANITLIQGDHQKELTLLVSTTPVSVKGDEMVLVCLEDITERKQTENLTRIQRDLGLALGGISRLEEAIPLCVKTAIEAAGMDSGGVYFIDSKTRGLDLTYSVGLSPEFVQSASHFDADSQNVQLVMGGKPIYKSHSKLGVPLDETRSREGLRAIAIIPILHESEVIACLNVASHTVDEIPHATRHTLETIGAQIGEAITRLRAEEALRESEEKFRTLFELSPFSTVYSDLQGNILECNQQFVNLHATKQGPEAQVGRNVSEFFLEEEWPLLQSSIEKIIREKTFQDPVEYNMLREDGTRFIGEANATVFKNTNGEPIALLAHVHDITDRKEAEEALIKSEERFRDLAQLLPEGVFEIDLEGKFTFANQKAFEISGYSKEDIDRGMNAFQMFIPEDQVRIKENISLILRGKDLGVNEYTAIRKDGTLYPVLLHSAVIVHEGKPIGLRGIIIDITDRKHAEEALRESTQKWQTTFDTINDPIYIQDAERRIVQCNTAALAFIKKPLKYVLDHDCCQLLYGVSEPIEKCPFMRAKESKKRETLVLPINEKWLNISVDPILDEHGTFKGAVHMMEDITEAKLAEEQLKRSLEEREILFRELKHRVKNNLQLLSSMVGMQTMRMDSELAIKKFQEIQSVIDTIALIYSRAFEETGISGLNLNDFIEELITGLLKFKTKEDMQINYSITGDNIQLSTDQAIPLALIANELVFNALKHAFPDRKQGTISISLSDENDHITMIIADNGVGLSKDIDIDETKTLGLKLVRNLTQQLGGTCNMVIDKGTRHIIEVPKEVVK